MRKLSALVRAFLKWASRVLKPSTVAVYWHYFRRFIAYHGDKRINKLKPMHLSEWAKTWHEAQAMKRLFNWAVVDAGWTTKNPFQHVKHPPKGARRRILGRAEMLTWLRKAKADLRALFIAHRETFARPQELRDATWENVHAEDSAHTIRQALQAARASIVLYDFKCRKRRRMAAAPRVILLSPRACRLFLRLLSDKEPNGAIFRTRRGRAWTANGVRCRLRRMRTKWKWVRDTNGENVVPYTFRHTGATLASAAGIRDRALADVLGHVETSTTHRYQHLTVEHLRAAMQALWQIAPRR